MTDDDKSSHEGKASAWEGHTHKWGKADAAGAATCKQCGHRLPVDVIKEG